MNADDFGFSIDLTVRNEWKNIDLLRTSVQNCFIAVFADLDGCHAIAMVTGELLENALKYGNWSSAERAMFRLRVVGNQGNIEVSVQNPLQGHRALLPVYTDADIHNLAAYLLTLK